LAADVLDPEEARATAMREAEAINAEVRAWRAEPAQAAPAIAAAGSVNDLIARYKASRFYLPKRASTRRGYDKNLAVVSRWAGDFPVRAIAPPVIERFYTALLERAPGRANHIIGMVRILLEFARHQGDVAANAASRPRLIGRPKTGRVWSPEAVAAFVSAADRLGLYSIGTAVILDSWLGQREGDVLALTRPQYRGGVLHVQQSKTGERVALPLGMVPELAARLEAELARQAIRKVTALDAPLIVSEATGRPYKGEHFSHAFARVRENAATAARDAGNEALAVELAQVKFMHLRHTAVTRLAEAGASIPQIVAITGHTIGSVHAILGRYLVMTRELARGAFELRLAKEGTKCD
jgi:integrase